MTRSERLLAIMQSMRTRRTSVTAAILADEFGVSERTIYRDIAVLVSQGALIEGAAGLGYMLKPGHFLPPMKFEPDEADAIMLGLRYVIRRGDAALSDGARGAMAKISEVMPIDAVRRTRSNGLMVGPAGSRRGKLIAAIRGGIRLERKLTFAYTDAEGRSSTRRVWPVALGYFDDTEMLAAWCEMRGAFRHFRLDRMGSEHLTDDRIPLAYQRLLSDYRQNEPGAEL